MKLKKRSPWSWIPSLYIAESVPYTVVIVISTIMYKRLDVSNTEIALYTALLYLPWVIKPLWSPFIDIFKTKRHWILITQLIMGAAFAGIAFSLVSDDFFRYSLALMWLVAFNSATHDIAADGFYLIELSSGDQAYFVGIRSTFYRLGMIFCQGALVIFAGYLEQHSYLLEKLNFEIPQIKFAWLVTFLILSLFLLSLALYHYFFIPVNLLDKSSDKKNFSEIISDFFKTFLLFFEKENIWLGIAFVLIYRLGESQLVKLAAPFLLDAKSKGGLALNTGDVGLIYGTIGMIALSAGGILGGIAVAKKGLKYWIWWMLVAINLPNLVYVYLSFSLSSSFFIISSCVAIEQFGYGFGFTAIMMYMMMIAEGKYKTVNYAIATGFMALGMMLPGSISGWIQEMIGYKLFFIWVVIATVPSFILANFLNFDAQFGKKTTENR
ncbi:MAG: AmpG family muropeptide MFS transporter [Ignavibacteria bacterium]|nr:AmpG family muropeptide MFS transporter [Ignavibacteria bacterium]